MKSKIKPQIDIDPFWDKHDLAAAGIRFGDSQLRRLWSAAKFPAPTRLSARKLVWRRSQILAWIGTLSQAAADAAPTTGKKARRNTERARAEA